jgi:hypothetical protein
VGNGARIGERLVGVALAGAVALNYPLLYLFSGSGTVFGIPSLYLYLFLVWAALIGFMAAIMRPRIGADRSVLTEEDAGEPPRD